MKTGNPIDLGFAPDRLVRIQHGLQKFIDDGKIAGTVSLVARRGQIVHFQPQGWMDLATKKPMQLDAIFRIYSMTKAITSTAMMLLFEENCFRLSDPVSRFIPAFKDLKVIARQEDDKVDLVDPKREVIIQDLFTHSAGLSYGFDENDYLDMLYREQVWKKTENNPEFTLKDFIDALVQLPLRFHPGSAFHYSVSIDVLGYLVEVISGLPFDRFLQERIFDPLGMVDTGFWVPPEKVNRFASNYGPDEKQPGTLKDIDPNEKSGYIQPAKMFSGGGGLVSTAMDYLRFLQMLLNHGELEGVRLLGRKTVESMFQNHLPPGVFVDQNPAYGFGLGGSVVLDVAQTRMLGSQGLWAWGGAANTKFWIDPQEQLIGILMLQFMPNDLYLTEADYRNLVYQALVD